MKFNNYLAAFICLLFLCACSGSVKNNDKPSRLNDRLLNSLKNKSLKEIRQLMQEQSDQLDGVLKLAGIRLEITPASSTQNGNNDGVIREPLYQVAPADFIENGLKALASNFTFQQDIKPEGSVLLTYLANNYTPPDFYSKDNSKAVLSTEVAIQKLYLHDHSAVKEQLGTAKLNDPVQLSIRKPIDSLTAQFKFNVVKKVNRVVLDKDMPKKEIGDGYVELKQLGNSSATLMAGGHTERILVVAGIDAKGRVIDQNSSTSNSLPSPAKLKYFAKLNKVFKATVLDIDAEKYKTTAELLTALKPKLPPNPDDDELSAQNEHIFSYHFYQDISKIVVYYASEVKDITHTITLQNKPVIASGLALAQGDKGGVNGIINADGTWLIKPVYNNLIEINPYYYKLCKGSGNNSCDFYRLDISDKKLVPFNESALKGYALGPAVGMENVTFYKIDPADVTVPSKGALNKKGEAILKPVYDLIDYAGNYLLAAKENNTTNKEEFSLFTQTGSPVIEASREVIGQDGQFILFS